MSYVRPFNYLHTIWSFAFATRDIKASLALFATFIATYLFVLNTNVYGLVTIPVNLEHLYGYPFVYVAFSAILAWAVMTFGFKSKELFSFERNYYTFTVQSAYTLVDIVGTNWIYVRLYNVDNVTGTIYIAVGAALGFKIVITGFAWLLMREQTKKLSTRNKTHMAHEIGVESTKAMDGIYQFHMVTIFVMFISMLNQWWLVNYISTVAMTEVVACAITTGILMFWTLLRIFVERKSNENDQKTSADHFDK